jgi:hypothetical protein
MSKKDWIPRRELDLVDLIAQWIAALSNTAKQAAFGWDTDKCAFVLLKLEDFLNARREYKIHHTPGKWITKDDAKREAVKAMRSFNNSSVRFNQKMEEEDKLSLGVHESDTKPTPKPDPTDLVDVQFSTLPSDHHVIAKYRIAGSTKRGKGSYHAAEIRYWVQALDAAAPVGADYDGWRSVVNTASPWENVFPGADAGKRLYVIMRWTNAATRGKDNRGKGPWSAITNIIIP